MSLRQEASGLPSALDALQHLLTRLSAAASTAPPLTALLEKVLGDMVIQWPIIAHAAVYLRQPDGTLTRQANIGTLPLTPPAGSVTEHALTRQHTASEILKDGRLTWAAPLVVRQQAIGSLTLEFISEMRPSDALQTALAALVPAICLSIDHLQQQEKQRAAFAAEQEQRTRQLERLAAFGQVITITRDQQAIIQRLVDILPDLLPAELIVIQLYDAAHSTLTQMSSEQHAPLQTRTLSSTGTGVEAVITGEKPTIFHTLKTSIYPDHKDFAARGFSTLLTAPLMVEGQAHGALSIGHTDTQTYQPIDLALLQQIGNLLALALENANLKQSTDQRQGYEAKLDQITEQLQQQYELQDLLQSTMQELGAVLGAKQARTQLQAGLKSGSFGAGLQAE